MWKKFTLFVLFACAMKGGMALAENFESLDAIINVDKQIRDYKHDKKMQKKAEKRREREKKQRHHHRDKHRRNHHDEHCRHQ